MDLISFFISSIKKITIIISYPITLRESITLFLFSSKLSLSLRFQIRSFPNISLVTNRFSRCSSDADGTQQLDDSYRIHIINFKCVASISDFLSSCVFFKAQRSRSMHHVKKMRVAASPFHVIINMSVLIVTGYYPVLYCH